MKGWKKLAVWCVLPLVALIYSGWILYSRRAENRALDEQTVEKKAEQERDEARKTVESLGGSEFAILNFYASPGAISRGEAVQICYGVSNAKTVTLEPAAGEVWPSASRCLDAKPMKTTTYTLTAVDASGNKKTASLTIEVK